MFFHCKIKFCPRLNRTRFRETIAAASSSHRAIPAMAAPLITLSWVSSWRTKSCPWITNISFAVWCMIISIRTQAWPPMIIPAPVTAVLPRPVPTISFGTFILESSFRKLIASNSNIIILSSSKFVDTFLRIWQTLLDTASAQTRREMLHGLESIQYFVWISCEFSYDNAARVWKQLLLIYCM